MARLAKALPPDTHDAPSRQLSVNEKSAGKSQSSGTRLDLDTSLGRETSWSGGRRKTLHKEEEEDDDSIQTSGFSPYTDSFASLISQLEHNRRDSSSQGGVDVDSKLDSALKYNCGTSLTNRDTNNGQSITKARVRSRARYLNKLIHFSGKEQAKQFHSSLLLWQEVKGAGDDALMMMMIESQQQGEEGDMSVLLAQARSMAQSSTRASLEVVEDIRARSKISEGHCTSASTPEGALGKSFESSENDLENITRLDTDTGRAAPHSANEAQESQAIDQSDEGRETDTLRSALRFVIGCYDDLMKQKSGRDQTSEEIIASFASERGSGSQSSNFYQRAQQPRSRSRSILQALAKRNSINLNAIVYPSSQGSVIEADVDRSNELAGPSNRFGMAQVSPRLSQDLSYLQSGGLSARSSTASRVAHPRSRTSSTGRLSTPLWPRRRSDPNDLVSFESDTVGPSMHSDNATLFSALQKAQQQLFQLEEDKKRMEQELEESTESMFSEANEKVRVERVKSVSLEKQLEALQSSFVHQKELQMNDEHVGDNVEGGARNEEEAMMMAAVSQAARDTAEAEESEAEWKARCKDLQDRSDILEEALHNAIEILAAQKASNSKGNEDDDEDDDDDDLAWAITKGDVEHKEDEFQEKETKLTHCDHPLIEQSFLNSACSTSSVQEDASDDAASDGNSSFHSAGEEDEDEEEDDEECKVQITSIPQTASPRNSKVVSTSAFQHHKLDSKGQQDDGERKASMQAHVPADIDLGLVRLVTDRDGVQRKVIYVDGKANSLVSREHSNSPSHNLGSNGSEEVKCSSSSTDNDSASFTSSPHSSSSSEIRKSRRRSSNSSVHYATLPPQTPKPTFPLPALPSSIKCNHAKEDKEMKSDNPKPTVPSRTEIPTPSVPKKVAAAAMKRPLHSSSQSEVTSPTSLRPTAVLPAVSSWEEKPRPLPTTSGDLIDYSARRREGLKSYHHQDRKDEALPSINAAGNVDYAAPAYIHTHRPLLPSTLMTAQPSSSSFSSTSSAPPPAEDESRPSKETISRPKILGRLRSLRASSSRDSISQGSQSSCRSSQLDAASFADEKKEGGREGRSQRSLSKFSILGNMPPIPSSQKNPFAGLSRESSMSDSFQSDAIHSPILHPSTLQHYQNLHQGHTTTNTSKASKFSRKTRFNEKTIPRTLM
ncbi:hypothetical protein CBS101457_004296 [Exobasidium rhododendri]|nr:hypothetical protein CBS101457_004296 [Exobasidium rhododendri]